MNANKNELQHNTMLHYYIGTTINGIKQMAGAVSFCPLQIIAAVVMAWLLYSVLILKQRHQSEKSGTAWQLCRP